MNYKVLWLLVLLTAVGDAGTTIYGLDNGASEQNPLVEDAIDSVGIIPALFIVKSVAIGLGLIVQSVIPKRFEWCVPSGLLVPWGIVTISNAIFIFTVL